MSLSRVSRVAPVRQATVAIRQSTRLRGVTPARRHRLDLFRNRDRRDLVRGLRRDSVCKRVREVTQIRVIQSADYEASIEESIELLAAGLGKKPTGVTRRKVA